MNARVAGAAKNVLLVGCSIALPLLIGEWLARRQPGNQPFPRVYVGERADRPSANFVKDPQVGWRMRPHHTFSQDVDSQPVSYTSNAQGFRATVDYDTADPRPAITFVGASFTYGIGVGVDSTFAARVQRALPWTAVYDFAMPGAGFDQLWMSVRHQAAPFHPRLVIATFSDYDFARSQTAFRDRYGFQKPIFVLEADTLRPMRVGEHPNWLVRLLDRKSWLYHAVLTAMEGVGRRRPVGDWWRLNAAMARAVTADAQRMGAAIVFVRLPLKEGLPDFPTFRNLMAELGTGYVDLGAPGLVVPKTMFFKHDGHINDAGHQFVADAVLRWIRANQPALAAQPVSGTQPGARR